ncbi:MAG: single-stranded DNA-binding protein [Planctomycetes bacterium]|nr:single-stranded DNA-binding protein [Planctomycetota bacterium]
MASFNRVILMGNLTRDPQLSYLPSNTPVVEFGIATNRVYKKQDGSQGEEVCFTDCQMFGKSAETINKYLHKGDPLLVEGRLKLDQWQAQDGSKRSKMRVFVESFKFIGGRRDGGQQGQGQGGGGYGQQQQAPQPQQQQQPQEQQNSAPAQDFDSPPFNPTDDIPF